jgi:hypothetical protein
MTPTNPQQLTKIDVKDHAQVDAEFTIPNGGSTHKEFPKNLLSSDQ